MQTSSWRRFSALYSKELRELRPEIVIVVAAAVLICVTMFVKSGTSERDLLVLPIVLLMGLAGFLPFVATFKLLGREWSSNTIYLIMSLPASGELILGAKLAALISQYLLGTLVVIASAVVWLYPHLPELVRSLNSMTGIDMQLAQFIPGIAIAYLLSLTWLFYLISASFLSQLISKLFTRFNGAITLIAFVIILMLGSWLMEISRSFINTSSSINIVGTDVVSGLQQAILFMGINSAIYFIAAGLIMMISILVYNYRIEL
ncbi:MAG: hypothetical protein GXY34_01480 [Syntrophomonadaceae bacterium]|mgnify:CR=1 FL=1|nr:hypothetical protein [Syntrophomonadaceae bacterium]